VVGDWCFKDLNHNSVSFFICVSVVMFVFL